MMEKNDRSLHLPSEIGNLAIVWKSDADDEMALLIQKKMDKGIRFFVIQPVTTLGVPKGPISVSDEDIERLCSDGKINILERLVGYTIYTVASAFDAKQLAQTNGVGVQPFRTGKR